MEASYQELDRLLTESAAQLDVAAGAIRELEFSPERNIKLIGEALAHIFEIQHEIYRIHPELQPAFLKRE
jgi:hypothetical protein